MTLLIVFLATTNLALGYALAVYLGHGQLPWKVNQLALPHPVSHTVSRGPESSSESTADEQQQTPTGAEANELGTEDPPVEPEPVETAPAEEVAAEEKAKEQAPERNEEPQLTKPEDQEPEAANPADDKQEQPAIQATATEDSAQTEPENVSESSVDEDLNPSQPPDEPTAADDDTSPADEPAQTAVETEAVETKVAANEVEEAEPEEPIAAEGDPTETEVADVAVATESIDSRIEDDNPSSPEQPGEVEAAAEHESPVEEVQQPATAPAETSDSGGELDDKFLAGIAAFQTQLEEQAEDAANEEASESGSQQTIAPQETASADDETVSESKEDEPEETPSRGEEVLAGIESFRQQLTTMQQAVAPAEGEPAEQATSSSTAP